MPRRLGSSGGGGCWIEVGDLDVDQGAQAGHGGPGEVGRRLEPLYQVVGVGVVDGPPGHPECCWFASGTVQGVGFVQVPQGSGGVVSQLREAGDDGEPYGRGQGGRVVE